MRNTESIEKREELVSSNGVKGVNDPIPSQRSHKRTPHRKPTEAAPAGAEEDDVHWLAIEETELPFPAPATSVSPPE